MRDRYGRTIDYMRISITDRCNLRCRYCMPEGISLVPMKDILTYEEIELVCRAAAAVGIRKLKITGGEPLVRLDCADLIGKLKAIPGIEQVTMTTNGVLLGDALPRLLESPPDAVNVSLDTLDRAIYREITGRDELDKVLDGISRAMEAGLRVKINCVLQKGLNEDAWRGLAALTEEQPLDVRFIEMMPIGSGKNYEPVYNEVILEQLNCLYPGICADGEKHGNGPAVYYRIPQALGSIGFISAMHGKFCESCNRLRLTSQGQLKPCLCYEKSVDLRSILRETSDEKATREKLEKAICRAIEEKPRAHRFERPEEVTEPRKMVQIGG